MGCLKLDYANKVIRKVRRLGGENGQFGIIGHQVLNWDWNFTKPNKGYPN